MNLYLHIPFCASRCSYCDFYTRTNVRLKERFVSALLEELRLRAPEAEEQAIGHIYFGGGTPSLLTPEELGCIFDQIRRFYDISEAEEITLEANPDDMTEEYAEAIACLPINRVSMGVQSFQEHELRFLGRRHSAEEVYEAVKALRAVGIENLSLDLIYGLPNQTEAIWEANLDAMLSIAPPHISAYHLIYEEGTPMMRALKQGRIAEVSEELSLHFFRRLITRLGEAGYEHYEISNFAQPGRYARLNTGYWQGEHYLGFGPSAHSYSGNDRSHNIASTTLYCVALEEGRRAHSIEVLSAEDKLHEYIMTRLRTMWGINLTDMAHQFSDEARAKLLADAEGHLRRGTLILEGDRLCLSSEGVFVSDGIIADLF